MWDWYQELGLTATVVLSSVAYKAGQVPYAHLSMERVTLSSCLSRSWHQFLAQAPLPAFGVLEKPLTLSHKLPFCFCLCLNGLYSCK